MEKRRKEKYYYVSNIIQCVRIHKIAMLNILDTNHAIAKMCYSM